MEDRSRARIASHQIEQLVIYVAGGLEALLIARLVLKLFAARPDNPVVQALFAVTDRLIWPLAILDAGQPKFGAVLEFSTLVLAVVLPALVLSWGRWRGRVRVHAGYREQTGLPKS